MIIITNPHFSQCRVSRDSLPTQSSNFGHHPQGKVWQVSSKLSTTPMRVVFDSDMSCPDSSDSVTWEWFNTTTPEGQQIYIKDEHIKVKCIDNFS